jgi:catalase
MLQGRTFSYSDTQRYRVGTNYLQLPINRPATHVATNQRDGQMAYHQDIVDGMNPHVNYEPSTLGGLKEAPRAGQDHTPMYQARLVREKISKQNNFKQAGDTYRNFEQWERDELISNLGGALAQCTQDIQDRMISMLTQCDEDYGRRVAEGIKQASMETKADEAIDQAETESTEAKPY